MPRKPHRDDGAPARRGGERGAGEPEGGETPRSKAAPRERAPGAASASAPSDARAAGWLDPGATVEEPDVATIRPQRLSEYVGQTALKAKLGVFVQAAAERGEPLDHTLLHGPPGLGKTTMAQILANELGVTLHVTSGPAVEHKGVLAGLLLALQPRDVLFIDEIHRLSATVEESLYSAMEDGRIDLPMGEGSRARTVPFELVPFTLIGATTRTGLLSAPLRGRFQIVEGLEFYRDEELARIVRRTADILAVPATDGGALEIGRRSRGTPRIANRLTRRVRDFAQVRGRATIDVDDARYALEQLGIDPAGLDATDRRILSCILDAFDGGPVGIEAIAATLSEPRDTLEDVYEPFLLQRGLIVRTPRGRMITRKALEHLGRDPSGWPGPGGGSDGGQGALFD